MHARYSWSHRRFPRVSCPSGQKTAIAVATVALRWYDPQASDNRISAHIGIGSVSRQASGEAAVGQVLLEERGRCGDVIDGCLVH
jgi:hypothetical protein